MKTLDQLAAEIDAEREEERRKIFVRLINERLDRIYGRLKTDIVDPYSEQANQMLLAHLKPTLVN